jgi:alkylated DNA repair dioxygenase AlkB
MWRLFPAWRAGDEEILPALRTLFSYDPAGRATGWLLLPDRPPMTSWPGPFTKLGPALLGGIEAATGVRFTAVCFQAYLDGAGCDWHHDREWDAQAVLSLGVTRMFGLRNDEGRTFVPLAHGDLLFMPPGFQGSWEHCVPVEDVQGERCSLVFRSPLIAKQERI